MKKKWAPVAILSGIEIALFVLLYCKGFRITYAPDLENSWDAVSAFAAWGGVFMSLLAILVAGIVAWRQNEISRKQIDIADKQNKIALFEKRFEIYDILSICTACIQKKELIKESGDIIEFLFVRLVKNLEEYRQFIGNARVYLTNCSEKLRCANFFFSEEIAVYIVNVAIKLLILANADAEVEKPEKYNEIQQEFFDAVEDLDKNGVVRRIEAETKII